MAQRQSLLIVGGGGHCKVVIDVARASGFAPDGVLDARASDTHVLGVPVLGGDDEAPALFQRGYRRAFIALGDNALRLRVALRYREMGFELPTLVHPSATLSDSATLGDDVLVMPHAVVNAAARIGADCIVNTGAIIEHDCVLGAGTHAAPRSVMGGNVVVGNGAFFGIGAVARPTSRIGAGAIVGAGAVVIGVIEPGAVVVGTPARPLAEGRGPQDRRPPVGQHIKPA